MRLESEDLEVKPWFFTYLWWDFNIFLSHWWQHKIEKTPTLLGWCEIKLNDVSEKVSWIVKGYINVRSYYCLQFAKKFTHDNSIVFAQSFLHSCILPSYKKKKKRSFLNTLLNWWKTFEKLSGGFFTLLIPCPSINCLDNGYKNDLSYIGLIPL